MFFPSTACLIQNKIGASHAWGFDLAGACSGFTFSLATASQLVSTGRHNHALVVGADIMSSIIDYTDRATCVLFGDGAGAAVVSAAKDPAFAILDFAHEIDGSGAPFLQMPAGGSLRPASRETVEQRLHYVKQDGQAVFKFAVRKTEEISRRDHAAQQPVAGRHRRCSSRTRRTGASSPRQPTGWASASRRWSSTSSGSATPPPRPSRSR